MTKKDMVLDAASRLFAEAGYESTSVAQICAEAGVSKGLIYHHFSSKEEILKEIFGRTTERMIDMGEDLSTQSAQERLLQMIGNVLDQIRTDKLFFQLNLNIMFQPKTRLLLNEMIKTRAEHLLTSVKSIFDDLDPANSEVRSFMLIAEMDGIALNYLSVFETYPIERIKAYLLEKYSEVAE